MIGWSVEISNEDEHGRRAEAEEVADKGGPPATESGRNDSRYSRERLATPEKGDDPLTADYQVSDEPIPDDWPVDYRYQFELMRDRVEREEDRGKSLDGKIATVIAGITASIGFSLRDPSRTRPFLALKTRCAANGGRLDYLTLEVSHSYFLLKDGRIRRRTGADRLRRAR